MTIPLAKPIFDKEMSEAATNALQNEKFVMGESVFKFEEEFARYCGVKRAISTSSGTFALQFALQGLGIKPKDKVITTPYSFIATANAAYSAGATPVFEDINVDTFNIDPAKVKNSLYSDAKSVMPVHLYGYPADMDQIIQETSERGYSIVEDCCQAHGAKYHGKRVGSLGDVGCFSFYPSKNMTVCGDGGMATTNNEEAAAKIAKLRDCGRKSHYEHDIFGTTARLNTVNAAIGRIQLKKLDVWNEKRRSIARLYNKLLSGIDEISLPPAESNNVQPVYHLYVIKTKQRDELKSHLENNGVQCGIHYPIPIHLQPIYQQTFGYKMGDYPNSERLSNEVLSIPIYPEMEEAAAVEVSEKIRDFFNKIK